MRATITPSWCRNGWRDPVAGSSCISFRPIARISIRSSGCGRHAPKRHPQQMLRNLRPVRRRHPRLPARRSPPQLGRSLRSGHRQLSRHQAEGFSGHDVSRVYLQLLKEMAPQVIRVSVVQTQASSWRGDFAVIEAVARSYAVAPVRTLIRDDPADIERAIATFAPEPNGGLILPPDAITFKHRASIVALVAKHRLPTVFGGHGFVEAGGLMFYGANLEDIYRRAAS